MDEGGNTVPRIEKSEHIGPKATGDNIEAKRVAPYGYAGGGSWSRMPAPFIDSAYDDIEFTNPDGGGNYQTITYKLSGNTVRTLNLLFDGNNKVTGIVRS